MSISEFKYKTRNPAFRELIKEKLKGQHFMRLMDFEITEINEGEIKGELNIEQKHHQQNGFLHGGVISTMSDIVMGFAAFSLVPEDFHVVTAELKVSYFAPGIGEKAFAFGRVLKSGKKLNFCEAEIYIENKGKRKLIAHATSTMASILPEEMKNKK
ncbi:MAG: PaaI family thioesterase [Cytophagales bacterium]